MFNVTQRCLYSTYMFDNYVEQYYAIFNYFQVEFYCVAETKIYTYIISYGWITQQKKKKCPIENSIKHEGSQAIYYPGHF